MTRPLLFTPMQIRGITLKNRVMISPMADCSADDGVVGYGLVPRAQTVPGLQALTDDWVAAAEPALAKIRAGG